jgi:tRNA-splicing ligase RtcB
MPAWCGFRDAARAHEADVLKAGIVNGRPQDPRYQDSPLTVIGEHDEGTVNQMRNCMKVGNVVSGVICTDGHLGYAQPVGGVIAYEKQISISGVGFDIGCGNMAVRLDVPFAAVADRVGDLLRHWPLQCTRL